MSVYSDKSLASEGSQRLLDKVSNTGSACVTKLLGTMDHDLLQVAWSALGDYVQKQIRIGRGISIPKFGLFTLSAQDFDMEGTTNPEKRELENREPVFIVSKDFAKGLGLIPAVWRLSGLRPLVLSTTSGKI